MNVFCFFSRRHALAALAFGLGALAGAPAIADGDIYVHAGANFKPVTIAVTPFAGEQAGDKISGVVSTDFARSIFLLPLNPSSFPETITNPDATPNRAGPPSGRRTRHCAIPFVGHRDRRTGRRAAIFH
jgi:TolB protein